MDASILVVGNEGFLAALLTPIRDVAASTIEMSPDPHEAAPLIQAQQPDLLIVQASQPSSLDLCRQIKAQHRLAWMYCLMLDDRSAINTDMHEAIVSTVEKQLLGKSGPGETALAVKALESGADAYLQVNFERLNQPDDGIKLSNAQVRLVQAYIQAGLRRVHNHRELMRRNDLLSTIALSDPLTELNNRRAFEWELPRQLHNARSRSLCISLLMLDVDFFKLVNDQHGHLVGDRALQLLSSRLRHNLRFYDTPFRYGGEEFAIILGNTDSREAILIARRLCRLIAAEPFTINDTLDLHITISAGTASLRPEDDARGISLLQRADQNLLKAKSLGRNRVVSCQEAST